MILTSRKTRLKCLLGAQKIGGLLQYKSLCVTLQACLEAPFCVRGDVAGDIGSWNFSDCIMAQFEMEFKVFVDRKNLNKTLLFDVS